MADEAGKATRITGSEAIRLAIALAVGFTGGIAALLLIDDPPRARAAAIAVLCLALWLGEAVPAFVPTVILLAAAPWAGVPVKQTLAWAADPVLALFFGGFVLAAALARQGIDRRLVAGALAASGGSAARLIGLTIAAGLFLSMWMSNVAAAALLLAALAPVLGAADLDPRLRRALLLGIAFGCNLGGMATPIGSGPNAIALAAVPSDQRPGFAQWIAFATPLAVVAAAASWWLITAITGARGVAAGNVRVVAATALTPAARVTVAIALVAIAAWLTQPWHGVDAPIVALALAATLFATRLAARRDLAGLDWETLLLIAGGIALGHLLEHAGLAGVAATALADAPPWAVVAGAIAAAALLSAVMSNTATATMLMPVAVMLDPQPPTLPLLVALACSFGLPFAISTPPNAMAVGAGLRPRDLLLPGVAIMLLGCVLLAVTGGRVLAWFGF